MHTPCAGPQKGPVLFLFFADKPAMNFGGLFLFLGLASVVAHAEYRMFTLKITNTKTQDYRLVDSTLDPIQYPYYYPVQKDEIVQYTDTWRCYGRTGGGQPPCPNPKTATAAAANQTSPAPVADPSQNQGPAPITNPVNP